MIIEMRTYRMKPGSIPEVENRFAEGLRERTKVSPLGAFFHTEVGPLNRIIHCWPYDDLAHRTKIRSQSIPGWPPKIQEFIENMESKIINLAPFSANLKEPRQLGCGLYRIGAAQPVDPRLGLQGRCRTLPGPRRSPCRRRLAARDPRHIRAPGKHAGGSGRVLAAEVTLCGSEVPPPPCGGGGPCEAW